MLASFYNIKDFSSTAAQVPRRRLDGSADCRAQRRRHAPRRYRTTPPAAQVKGDITINMPQQQVQYRKKVPLSGGAALVVDASCRLEGGPPYGVGAWGGPGVLQEAYAWTAPQGGGVCGVVVGWWWWW